MCMGDRQSKVSSAVDEGRSSYLSTSAEGKLPREEEEVTSSEYPSILPSPIYLCGASHNHDPTLAAVHIRCPDHNRVPYPKTWADE